MSKVADSIRRGMEEAVAYAKREGLVFTVIEDVAVRTVRPRSYADNFRFDRVG